MTMKCIQQIRQTIREQALLRSKCVAVITILFLLGIQPAQAQYIKDNFQTTYAYLFFRSNDNLAYKMLQKLYAPNDEFIKGTVKSCSALDVGIDASDYFLNVTVACDNGVIEARLHMGDDYFDYMKLLRPTTWASSFVKKTALKAFADEMAKKYNADGIAWIEKKMGKRIYAMNEIELYLSALTLHYYTYDEDTAFRNL